MLQPVDKPNKSTVMPNLEAEIVETTFGNTKQHGFLLVFVECLCIYVRHFCSGMFTTKKLFLRVFDLIKKLHLFCFRLYPTRIDIVLNFVPRHFYLIRNAILI